MAKGETWDTRRNTCVCVCVRGCVFPCPGRVPSVAVTAVPLGAASAAPKRGEGGPFSVLLAVYSDAGHI